MKRTIKIAFVATFAMVVGYNIYKSQSVTTNMSEMALANMEALADPEIDIPYICPGDIPACYDDYYNLILDGIKQH